jgi:antitoxin VapB
MAKIFWTGRSQAVRLPKAYRFDASEVRITREGDRIILESASDAQGASAAIDTDAAWSIDQLREAVHAGLESGDAEPWDADEIKRLARRR